MPWIINEKYTQLDPLVDRCHQKAHCERTVSHTTPGSEGSLRGRFNRAPSGGLNGGSTVGF